jgi:hypothetical protein
LGFHYITASNSAQQGDIAFYYGKNRNSVFLSQTSPNFLAMLITDENTIIGPQWVNHSIQMNVASNWLSTDYGMTSNPDMYSAGEIFLLAQSPATTNNLEPCGYVLIDYVVEFAQHQLSPRSLTLPYVRAQYFQTNIGVAAATVTKGSTFWCNQVGNRLDGASASSPSGWQPGDIYKVILDVTNSNVSSWVGVGISNLFQYNLETGFSAATPIQPALTIVDGTTFYAVAFATAASGGNPIYCFYPNPETAYTALVSDAMNFGLGAAITFNLQCWLSLIGTVAQASNNPNF